ncbi:hypothetical protein QCA50_006243 [Cerrena zonata]|uniref:F-box domain-containing protein n=1 Tax=Cerrena zonata TaxID=2478898 RepID=A0AAW0GCU9_9APHY
MTTSFAENLTYHQRYHEDITQSEISAINEDTRSRQQIIRHALQLIVEKKRFLNNLLLVSRLSSKLLSRIFSYLTCDVSSHPKVPPYQCITFTHVCHRWREIALQTHDLWSYIHLGHPECVALYLERSGQSLLQVTSMRGHRLPSRYPPRKQLHSPSDVESLKLVLGQSHRLRALTLDLPIHAIEEAFVVFRTNLVNAPVLRSITLLNRSLYSRDSGSPDILFARSFPALLRIQVSRYPIVRHPALLQFTALDSLIIRNSSQLSDCPIQRLLHVLRNNPKMRVLEYTDKLYVPCPHSNTVPDEPSSLVNLPSLETLEISASADCINHFLTRCTFPSSTITIFNACHEMYSELTPEDVAVALGTLQSIITHISHRAVPMVGLGLSFDDLEEVDDDEFATPLPLISQLLIETYHFDPSLTATFVGRSCLNKRNQFRFDYPSPLDSSHADILHNLLYNLPLSNVIYLRLDTDLMSPVYDAFTKDVGVAVSSLIERCSISGIQVLELSGYIPLVLPFILDSANHTHSSADPIINTTTQSCRCSPLLSSLHTLIFSRTREKTRPDSLYGPKHLDFGSVFDALQSQGVRRDGTCSRLSVLVLQQCSLELETLYELVDSVSDIVFQRGRFTTNPPSAPYDPPPLHHSPQRSSPAVEESEVLPDADLDRLFTLPGPPTMPEDIPFEGGVGEVCWDAYVAKGRVTFDFRGSSGIQIEHMPPVSGW